LQLTGALKVFELMDGQMYSSSLLPDITVRLEWEGTTVRTTVTNSLRQFEFSDLDYDKTYSVIIGMKKGILVVSVVLFRLQKNPRRMTNTMGC
jgi:hypothetical protein